MKQRKIEHALVDLLADQVRQTTFAGSALIVLVGCALWFTPAFSKLLIIGWVVVGLVIAVPRYIVIGHIKQQLAENDSRLPLEIVIGIALFTSGLHWGSAAWFFLDTSSTQGFALVCGAILGVIASALAIFSTRPLTCCIFAVTVFIIAAAKLAQLESWGLAIMCLVVLPPYAILSRTLGRRIEKSITQDFRNAELLEEVQATKDALEKSSREKSLFMAATSHDLRQPLHAQNMILQILSNRAQGTEFSELVEKMMVSNDALIELFNALLEVSQLDAGTISVHASHHSLLETANRLIDEFHATANQKGLALELIGDDHVVHTDPVLLMRILRNLLSNAIKFTEHGYVCMTLKQQQNLVEISLEDTGIGIHKSDQQTIFREYTQLSNPSRDRSKGIGLGLALVRRMCELLKLELQLHSTPGEGSRFQLRIPAGDPQNIVQLGKELVPEPIQNLDVMVIDDELPILDAMNTLFADWSCRTRAFTRLADACEAAATGYTPDLIISDYRLNEEANGIEAISRLRQLIGKDVPSIIISGDTDPRLLEKIHNADFFLLHKPVRTEKLRKVIGSLLGERGAAPAYLT
ncbi:MAG: ATP-binding protein [Pseudomonadota bacterium]